MNPADQSYPQISIITVSFNAAQFIEQTIQSVLSQTYPHIEYIIIDGGSKDGTVDIIRQYESSLAYWHSRPDRGVGHAFNLGLKEAHGDWILFLNADDFFHNNQVVEKMVPHLIRHKDADVVFGQLEVVTSDVIPQPVPFSKILGSPWRWQEFRWHNTIPHQSAFTNKNFFARLKGFDEGVDISVDYEHYLKAGPGLKAQFIPTIISRMRKGGISNSRMVRSLNEFRLAQERTKALPKSLAWLIFFCQVARIYLGIMAHKFLDTLAHTINWPGRNTGRSIGH